MTELERLEEENYRLKGLLAAMIFYAKKVIAKQEQPNGTDWEAYRRLREVVEDSEKALRQ